MELLSFLENKIRHAKLKQKKEALQAINILKQQLKKILENVQSETVT